MARVGEMSSPLVAAGVKEAHDLSGIRVNSCKIGPFVQIALGACEGEILRNSRATMLPGNHVLDMKTQVGKILRQVTVLTAATSPSPARPAHCCLHQAALGGCSKARASAFNRLRMELA